METTGYFDIECLSGNKAPDPEKEPVTCVGIADKNGYVSLLLDDVNVVTQPAKDWKVVRVDDEKILLRTFNELLSVMEYDILTAWNAPFDIEYLQKRMIKLGLDDLYLDGTNTFGLLAGY